MPGFGGTLSREVFASREKARENAGLVLFVLVAGAQPALGFRSRAPQPAKVTHDGMGRGE